MEQVLSSNGAGPRIRRSILPCGVQVVAYRLPAGASVAAILISRSSVGDLPAGDYGQCGRCARATLLPILRSLLHEALPRVHEIGSEQTDDILHWEISSCPGDLDVMLAALAGLLEGRNSITPDALAAELRRRSLEVHLDDPQHATRWLHNFLSQRGEKELCPPFQASAAAGYTELYEQMRASIVRPETTTLVIAGPHRPDFYVSAAARALAHFPAAPPVERAPQVVSIRPAGSITRPSPREEPVPVICAWQTGYLAGFKGATYLYVDTLRRRLRRECDRSGLSFTAYAGASNHHVYAMTWAMPDRSVEILGLLRSMMIAALDELENVSDLRALARAAARFEVGRAWKSPLELARGHHWYSRLHPAAGDPVTAQIKSLASVDRSEVAGLRSEFLEPERALSLVYVPPEETKPVN